MVDVMNVRSAAELKKDTKCPQCGLLGSVCNCDSQVDLQTETYKAFLSVETRGGHDDVITLIEKLPASESYLKSMLRKLSTECQVRGTYRIDKKQGLIELSGDRRMKLRNFFNQEKISFVG